MCAVHDTRYELFDYQVYGHNKNGQIFYSVFNVSSRYESKVALIFYHCEENSANGVFESIEGSPKYTIEVNY